MKPELISFRAWDRKRKKMFHDIHLRDDFHEFVEDDDFDIVQSTAIKDIEGAMIFVGDIVKDKDEYIGQVMFGNYKHGDHFHRGIYIRWTDGSNSNFPCEMNCETVVGNVFENEELLD